MGSCATLILVPFLQKAIKFLGIAISWKAFWTNIKNGTLQSLLEIAIIYRIILGIFYAFQEQFCLQSMFATHDNGKTHFCECF